MNVPNDAFACYNGTPRYPRKALRFLSEGNAVVVADFGKAVSVEGFDYVPQTDGFAGMTAGDVDVSYTQLTMPTKREE